jgi:hypothetical protein
VVTQAIQLTQTITQVDTQAPVIGTAGADATIECTATPTFTAPTAIDACNTVTVQQLGSDVTGGNSCAKTTTRTWIAVDGCGNSSNTVSQTITQVDTQAPVIGTAELMQQSSVQRHRRSLHRQRSMHVIQ